MNKKAIVVAVALTLGLPVASYAGNPCNPCGGKKAHNPCNPCGGKKAHNPCNPCGGKKAHNPCNPCNPCGGAGKIDSKLIKQPKGVKVVTNAKLVSLGKRLFNDKTLGKSGLACGTCHANVNGGPYLSMLPTFGKPYPHFVQMAKDRAGLKSVNAAEMVQLCMLIPMKADPLPWGSKKLAALTSYVVDIQKGFKSAKVPAMGKNPCNPCSK